MHGLDPRADVLGRRERADAVAELEDQATGARPSRALPSPLGCAEGATTTDHRSGGPEAGGGRGRPRPRPPRCQQTRASPRAPQRQPTGVQRGQPAPALRLLNLPSTSRAAPRNGTQVPDVEGVFELSTASVDNFVGKPVAKPPKA